MATSIRLLLFIRSKIVTSLDQPLHHSYVISSTMLTLPSEWGNQSGVNLDYKYCYINIKYDVVVILTPQFYNLMCTIEL